MIAFLRRRWRPILVAFIVLDIALVAGFAIWWTQGSPEASGPTLAPTLAVPAAAPAPAAQPTAAPAETPAPVQSAPEPPAPAPVEPTAAPAPAPALEPSGEAVLYRFGDGDATASFAVDEILNNAPFTALGVTDEAAGDIVIDWANPAASQLGTILINARTLETDNPFRDRAIRNSILESSQDQYEFISFAPTELRGLPDSVAVGDKVDFEVVGDLTIRDITVSTVWTVSVTLTSEDQISGEASTEVLRPDFDLQIPSVPRVAGVDDDVQLTLVFTAAKVA